MSLKTSRPRASKKNGLTPGGKTNRSMTNLATKAMAVKKSVSGQSLKTDEDDFITKSEYPFVKPGDRVDGLKKFQSGGNKGLNVDNDYTLKTQALEKTNVKPPLKK